MVSTCEAAFQRTKSSAEMADSTTSLFVHQKSCHRCGSNRNITYRCTNCVYTYCMRCVNAFAQEDPTSFEDGCPVCKRQCCCADKSKNCSRKIHCTRSCPFILCLKSNLARPAKRSYGESTATDDTLLQHQLNQPLTSFNSNSKAIQPTAMNHPNTAGTRAATASTASSPPVQLRRQQVEQEFILLLGKKEGCSLPVNSSLLTQTHIAFASEIQLPSITATNFTAESVGSKASKASTHPAGSKLIRDHHGTVSEVPRGLATQLPPFIRFNELSAIPAEHTMSTNGPDVTLGGRVAGILDQDWQQVLEPGADFELSPSAGTHVRQCDVECNHCDAHPGNTIGSYSSSSASAAKKEKRPAGLGAVESSPDIIKGLLQSQQMRLQMQQLSAKNASAVRVFNINSNLTFTPPSGPSTEMMGTGKLGSMDQQQQQQNAVMSPSTMALQASVRGLCCWELFNADTLVSINTPSTVTNEEEGENGPATYGRNGFGEAKQPTQTDDRSIQILSGENLPISPLKGYNDSHRGDAGSTMDGGSNDSASYYSSNDDIGLVDIFQECFAAKGFPEADV